MSQGTEAAENAVDGAEAESVAARPGFHRVVNERDGKVFEVKHKELLLMSAIQQEIDYPHNCRVGTCGTCKTKLLSGKIRPLVDFALSPLTNEELAQGYVLACQSMVNSDLRIDVSIGNHVTIPYRRVSGRVSSWRRLPGQVIDVRVRLDEPLPFMAGQYCQLAESGSFTRRNYSFCDLPPDPEGEGAEEVGFLVKYIPGGKLSGWLNEMNRTGTKMWLHGPQGRTGLEDEDSDAICIAGGTGLAPIASILADRIKRHPGTKFTVIFGVKGADDLFAREVISDLLEQAGDRIRFIEIVSDEPDGTGWEGPRGLVTDALTPDLVDDYSTQAAYVCGNLPMVEACEKKLVELGVDPEHIHADKFIPTGA